MTSLNTTNLESLANITFNDYKALHDIFQNRSMQYYAELQTQADNAGLLFVENYGALAEDIAVVGTPRGEVINNFIKVYAEAASKDFTWGSENRLRFQYELMQEDLDARQLDIANGGDGNLNFNQTNSVYAAALNSIGLPPEASFFYTPTTLMAEYNPSEAEFFFQTTVAGGGNGVFDIIQDAMLLGFGAGVSRDQELSEILEDYSVQAEWMTVTIEAMQDFVDEYGPNESTHLSDVLETYQQLLYLTSLTTGGLSTVAEWAEDLPSLADMLGSISSRIPSWISDPISNFDAAQGMTSPLVLDLDGDGIELSQMSNAGAVYWDIDLDGFAEDSGWVTGGDGLLAIDLNADGIINDHSELFGDQTGSPNGFAALAVYDTNSDGYITSADTQFDDLLVWVDANADGISQEAELLALDNLLITSIDLGYSNVSYTIAGNEVKQESTFTIDGNTRDIVDAWFAYDNVNTVYAGDYTLDVRTLFLPSLRGYGKLPDLHIAMSLDETLLDKVETIAVADADTLLSSSFDIRAKITDILYQWAGVDGISPTSRGTYIDARKLEFLEEFMGEEWTAVDSTPNPGNVPANELEEAFDRILSQFTAQILTQSNAHDVIGGDAEFDLFAGEITSADAPSFVSYMGDTTGTLYSSNENDYFVYRTGDGNDIIADTGGVDRLIFGDGITEDDIRLSVYNASSLKIYVDGNNIELKDQFISGNAKSIETAVFADGTEIDLLNNLTFTGTSGSDGVYGLANQDDTLVGGLGNDYLYGDTGNDSYFYELGDGQDRITDYGGIDQITLGSTVTTDDVRLFRYSSDLRVYVGGDYIELRDQFATNTPDQFVEKIIFDDTTEIDLTADLTFTGTSGSDTLSGVAGANDTLIGGEGNDYLFGDTGNDSYFYDIGHGNDRVTDYGGADQISLASGIAEDDIRFWRYSDDIFMYFGSNYIELDKQAGSNSIYYIEKVVLADTTEIDLLNNLTFRGTSAGGESVHGTNNDDILYGAGGADYLNGYAGEDIFAWLAADLDGSSDTIQDFSLSEDDKLDISDVLVGYDPLNDLITDFVRITDDGTHSYLEVDTDGGADAFAQIATIRYETGLTDEAALESSGTLITV